MFLRFFKSYQNAAHPHSHKKKISEWGRASPTPVRLPPAARPPARSPAGWALLRPEFSIPWIPGSRGRGEEDRGKVWERDGFGAWGEGLLSRHPDSPQRAPILQLLACSLAPFLYLGHSQDN